MESNNLGVRKGSWTKEEDTLLKKCIEKHGEGKWHQVPIRAGLNRCRKSCRLRWLNYLRPNIKRGFFSKDELDLILRLHKLLGNKWSLIAGRLPGRTANDVKNFWNTHVDKKLAFGQRMTNNNNNNNNNCNSNVLKTKTLSHSNIVRPRPLIFRKLLHVNQPTEVLSNNCKSSDKEKQCSGVSSSSQGTVNDNVQWWSKLLELSENSESGTVDWASLSGLGDEKSIFSVQEFDVWE